MASSLSVKEMLRVSGLYFWRWYLLSSAVSSLLSLALFHWLVQGSHETYETCAVMSGLLTLPINWLVGEQLTWGTKARGRGRRASRYYFVYGVGLLLDVWTVHALGHILRTDARLADAVGLFLAMGWTAPMNRLYTWRFCEDSHRDGVAPGDSNSHP